jgi:hypothetical protein
VREVIFPVGNMQGYLNFKGYREFANENRPDGWNAWVTFVISPAAREWQPKPSGVHKDPAAWLGMGDGVSGLVAAVSGPLLGVDGQDGRVVLKRKSVYAGLNHR